MPDILVLYASTHGQTEKIASRFCEVLREEGATALLHKVDDIDRHPSDFDAVVVGASVHGGQHQGEVVDWAKHHAATLNGMPSAFFSVSLTAAEDTDESRGATRGYVDDFSEQTGWNPAETATFAGALQYREYDFMTRLVMRLISKRRDQETDTSRDYEHTDWEAVDRFARTCAALVGKPRSG